MLQVALGCKGGEAAVAAPLLIEDVVLNVSTWVEAGEASDILAVLPGAWS